MSPSDLSLKRSGDPVEEQRERMHEPEELKDTRKIRPSKLIDQSLYKFIKTKTACTEPEQIRNGSSS